MSLTALAAADGAGTLGPAQLPGLRVSSLSTALYAHLLAANDNQIPADQRGLERATMRATMETVVQQGLIVRELIGTPLVPATLQLQFASDTLALVTDPAAYVQVARLARDTPTRLHPAIEYYPHDSRLAGTPAMVPGATRSFQFLVNQYCCAFSATSVALNPDGSGALRKGRTSYQVRLSKADALLLTVQGVRAHQVERYDENGQPYMADHLLKTVNITQVSGDGNVGVAVITEAGSVHDPVTHASGETYETAEVQMFNEW